MILEHNNAVQSIYWNIYMSSIPVYFLLITSMSWKEEEGDGGGGGGRVVNLVLNNNTFNDNSQPHSL